ncbi:glycosyltransferase family 2 protein [Roseivivax marinus]|uniref:glycosyltransferase family 2 protein n=1 Tax=Roseivivax marinus TaxID=1379903 RepID=UPI00273E3291|nr:glycosyltransferase family 2 protein [Roseivivax marinus]
MTRWGLVCTTNAATEAVLDFAAWHLEAGAHRLFIYLDAPDPRTEAALAAHPRIKVTVTDAAWWEKRNGRPDRHQNRQARNARHAYTQLSRDLDWLGHIDVDEFLLAERPVADHLAALPPDALTARVRPVELLARGDGDAPATRSFKTLPLDQARRQHAARACFGHWADHLSGGFLSHVAGKVFVRIGLERVQIRIHNAFVGEDQNPGMVELPDLPLAHAHAPDWTTFAAHYRFRLDRGSYRSELKPQARGPAALSLNALFAGIEAEGGEPALRAFYEEVGTATPALCNALEAEGTLIRRRFEPKTWRLRHFPGHVDVLVPERQVTPD